MKKWILLTSFFVTGWSFAVTTDFNLIHTAVNRDDKASLQRGARVYMNYCSGCHSLQYMRYNQMAKGLGLTTFDGEIDEPLLVNNLIFTKALIHDPIEISMPQSGARKWFGVVPPDLSLIIRQRSSDWVYTYLQSFYKDDTRPFGANNLLKPGVAMPNVLAPLQGEVVLKIPLSKATSSDVAELLVQTRAGQASTLEFDRILSDLVNFLTYVSEPVYHDRTSMGIWVLLYLAVFAIVAYLLKKQVWCALDEKKRQNSHKSD